MERLTKPNSAIVDEVKAQWRRLWAERYDDKVRAEGVASQAFSLCFVERGTIIAATRDFKPLDLKEILQKNHVRSINSIVGPPASVGGWTKFARTILNKQTRSRQMSWEEPRQEQRKGLQLKKGGRGWMHRTE